MLQKKAKIVVVPLGEVDFMMVNRLATSIGPVFGRSVDILKGMKVPEEAFNVIRNQHYGSIILAKLERVKANPKEHHFLIRVLLRDLQSFLRGIDNAYVTAGCPH